jgi:glycosyltransferase involved in cell wall biosynthesis
VHLRPSAVSVFVVGVRDMKVLHLPTNVASQISASVRALGALGVDARGLVWNNGPYCDPRELGLHEGVSLRRSPVRGVAARLRWWRELRRAVDWADVVHWHSNSRVLPLGLDLHAICASGKPRLVEFWGSDIRIPEREANRNPFYASATGVSPVAHGQNARGTHGQHARDAFTASLAVQRRFARAGFTCLLPGPELRCHVEADWFPAVHDTRARVMLCDYEPAYPPSETAEPLVVHAPSHRGRKGTDAVLGAVETLRRRGRRFRFELVDGRPRAESLEVVRRCDVFLDQFVVGAYGLAAIEAMALGKPCVGYILPELRDAYPPELPIVQADENDLADVLDRLLADGAARNALGRRGRAYVEQYHDALMIGRQLIEIYERLLTA